MIITALIWFFFVLVFAAIGVVAIVVIVVAAVVIIRFTKCRSYKKRNSKGTSESMIYRSPIISS